MAVEARHMNLPPSHLIANRDFVKAKQEVGNAQMDSALVFPDTLPNLYHSVVSDPVSARTSFKADSGLTCNVSAPRKRTRDSVADFDAFPPSQKTKVSPLPSFLDEDFVYRLHHQQSEIDFYIAQHAEKVRLEIEERRKRQSRMLIAAIHDAIVKKLKEKDEEIQRIGKLNWVLQERVKSLCVENQLWRDLAQTNEAAANSLRSNLEQVLAQVSEDHRTGGAGADDAESSCGSSGYGRDADGEAMETAASGGSGWRSRMCRKCGARESTVLLLPCRHLCLCTLCGSTLHSCPVCSSVINASVHVNVSDT